MLNQTGQVGHHTIPPSLTLPLRTSVLGSRFVACPNSPSSSSDYGCAVPDFESVYSAPLEEDYFEEDTELIDPPYPPYEFSTEDFSCATDPILESASTGREAEAMITKYGGDLNGG